MARSKKKPKPARTEPRIPLRALIGRIANASFALMVIGIVVAWGLGVGPLKERVSRARAAPVEPAIVWPALGGELAGTWLPTTSQRQLVDIARREVSENVFDQESLARARDVLHRTGWFVEPPTVRRGRGNVIHVEGEWRTPGAVVRHRDRDYLVSLRGELLPVDYKAGGAGPTLKVIEGVEFGPPSRDGRSFAWGEAWIGSDVVAALDLLTTLRTHFGATRVWGQIAGIDASEHRRHGRLSIVTDTGARVVWGAAPNAVAPGEQTTARKLERLAHLANEQSGRIDAGARRVEIHGAHVYVDQVQR